MDLKKTNSNVNRTNKEIGYGYGWLILILFYGYSLFSFIKQIPFLFVTKTQTIIPFIGLIIILICYFWFRNFLVRKNFLKGNISFSSFLSGVVTFIIITLLVLFLLFVLRMVEQRKEFQSFMNNFMKQNVISKKQEIEYVKLIMYKPETKSEVNDKILKIDEYKIFLKNKENEFQNVIDAFRASNSKYMRNKSVDEQINKLETMARDNYKNAIDCWDIYRTYYITDDEKYYNRFKQEFTRLRSQENNNETNKLVANIVKSLGL